MFKRKTKAAPLASNGSIFEGMWKGRKIALNQTKPFKKIALNHLRSHMKFHCEGKPYRFSG